MTNPIALREPATVMRLARLGSLHQCRLSFMRQLTRRMAREKWSFSRRAFDIDDHGVGYAVYRAQGPERVYSLVAFAHDLPPEQRSDRVIAEAWDATFTLFDGVPTDQDIERLSRNVPVQEAGRISETELSLSRANRSCRLWRHVVDQLAQGKQPEPDQIASVGYLMRTTAVYGSGKFGAADRALIAERTEAQAPFQIEMLSVYLTRAFVRDLAERMAKVQGGAQAVKLAPDTARTLGIGNSTGLGMAPFILNHPILLNNWIMAREKAIATVRAVETATDAQITLFQDLLHRSQQAVATWESAHPVQIKKIESLKNDLECLRSYLNRNTLKTAYPWHQLIDWSAQALSEEGQEFIASLVLEPYGDVVDDFSRLMSDDCSMDFAIDGAMPIARVKELIAANFGWALDLDWQTQENCARVWYVSEEKREPRLGERFEEDLDSYEQPLAPARDAAAAYQALRDRDENRPVAEFLLEKPEHRHTIRRVQMSQSAPYSEILDNTISDQILPIDLLRAKLSFFGATHFDPRSDRWVRICMYAGAPYPDELTEGNADLWVYPEVPL